MERIAPGTKRVGYLYAGVLRQGKEGVWTCSHLHRNRDMSPGIRQSARDCAWAELRQRGADA